jgi:hypothetical protein
MGIRKWIKNEWKDVKGNFKYEIYRALFGGTVIASFLAFWKSLQHAHFEPYLYCSILLLSASLFVYASKHSAIEHISPDSHPRAEITEQIDPKKPNLRADLLEVLFHFTRRGLGNDIFILLGIRVVNYGEEDAVVTDWSLVVTVGGVSMPCDQIPIPPNWRIRRMKDALGRRTDDEEIDSDADAFEHPLKKGVPKTRWIAFQVLTIPHRILPPHNAKFTLTLTDAFGMNHVTESGPGFAFDTGEIIVSS